jgi:uncharacterized protein
MGLKTRELLLVLLPIVALVAAAFALAYQFVEPAPPRSIAMSTGSEQGAYHRFGKQYAAALAKAGVTLDLKPSAGTLENLARLTNPRGGVQVALVQGGLANAEQHPELASLGRTFLEPLWLFHRADLPVERLANLAGKRIAVGPEGSGTRPLATTILKAGGVTGDSAMFIGAPAEDAVGMLLAGDADAIFLTMAIESPLVQKLLHASDVRLFSFAQAEALTRLYPYLVKIVLPAGVVDLAANIPAQDVALVASAATLVVRRDLHPALVGLLVNAAKTIHAGPGLFQKPGEYPQAVDTELPMDADAVRFYKNGPPLLERYLPFWLATFLDRMRIMLIPIATLLLPLVRIVPMAYQWRIKRRMLHWYGQLKKLERQIRADRSAGNVAAYKAEITRIDEAVSIIPIPLAYTDQFYTLRAAVDLVRQRIASIPAQ